MNEDYKRPDPDELLAQIQKEEQQRTRGKLKIFMGYAAGVGKTYSMLEAAHQRQAEGVDVVIAYVETHGRAETEALIKGLEIIPRRQIEYHGVALTEMDVDAVLDRKPQLALVDEFAHTNVPGSRHLKRYQDVEDLLDAGINVYTTFNIQHLESLNDIVHQITDITVRETIPDDVVNSASEIELIDLPPDELLQRLKEGKVYIPEQASRAAEKFFRKGNLTALRELSMRRAADRVDDQMLDYMETREISGPWPAKEHLMVLISSHPLSERLVRAGRRLSEELNADWDVVYIETPDRVRFSPTHSERVRRTLQLAEELGAKCFTISGRSVPETAIDFAKKHNVTKIIAGKPLRSRWSEVIQGSIVDEIIRKSGSIDVYIISDQQGPINKGIPESWRPHHGLRRYIEAILLVAVVTAIAWPLEKFIDPPNLVMLYLLAVVIAALFLGRGPSLLASIVSVLAFDYFFVNPRLSFQVADTQYLITFIGFFMVGLVVSNLASQVRDQVDASQRRESQMATLYSLSRDLTTAAELDTVLDTIVTHIDQTFSREVVILLPVGDQLEVRAASKDFTLDENEYAVAMWAYQHNQPAGRGTATLPAANVRYQPLVTAQGIQGILGVKPGDPSAHLTTEQRQLLDAYASLAALAIERAKLADEANSAQVMRASEKLQTALLNSISHSLRTPLASITGVLESLHEADLGGNSQAPLDSDARADLIETARGEAERLNRLVSNLLDMTRLEAGALKVNLEPSDIQDVIGTAILHMADELGNHSIKANVPDNLPLVSIDFVLIEQVFINLLDNAAKYSEPGKEIEISACLTEAAIQVDVADRGIGIPPEDLTRVFDKFYRVQRLDGASGTGLGLSICKGIIDAHGGVIWAQNRPGGGTIISFQMPLDDNSKPSTKDV